MFALYCFLRGAIKERLNKKEIREIECLSETQFHNLVLSYLAKKGFSLTNTITSDDARFHVLESEHTGLCLRYHHGHSVIVKHFDCKAFMDVATLMEIAFKENLIANSKSNRAEGFFVVNSQVGYISRAVLAEHNVNLVDKYALASHYKAINKQENLDPCIQN